MTPETMMRVAERQPERNRVEDARGIGEEVAAGDERQRLAAGRVRAACDDERPPQRVGGAEDPGREQAVARGSRGAARRRSLRRVGDGGSMLRCSASRTGAIMAGAVMRRLSGGRRCGVGSCGSRRAALAGGDATRDGEVDEPDRDDEQEQQPGDGGGLDRSRRGRTPSPTGRAPWSGTAGPSRRCRRRSTRRTAAARRRSAGRRWSR